MGNPAMRRVLAFSLIGPTVKLGARLRQSNSIAIPFKMPERLRSVSQEAIALEGMDENG
jgi:hypothetical protein